MSNENYTQVCVWQGILLEDMTPQDFENWMLENTNTRVKFIEEIETNPDKDENGNVVPETGGRNDLFFSVHTDDIDSFCIKKMQMGIRWVEDVLSAVNGGVDEDGLPTLYPERVLNYITWDAN